MVKRTEDLLFPRILMSGLLSGAFKQGVAMGPKGEPLEISEIFGKGLRSRCLEEKRVMVGASIQ